MATDRPETATQAYYALASSKKDARLEKATQNYGETEETRALRGITTQDYRQNFLTACTCFLLSDNFTENSQKSLPECRA